MTKALATLATGQHTEYLDLSRPLFEEYAARHGYAYCESNSTPVGRPASWGKLPLMGDLLDDYDEVLWIDCDTVIVEPSEDIAAFVPAEAWQGITLHRAFRDLYLGEVPSCGVWLVRRPMIAVLEQLWGMTHYLDHPWWEQAALHELLGYVSVGDDLNPVRRVRDTELYQHTHFLPPTWNSLEFENPNAFARIMHMPGVVAHEKRLEAMRFWVGRREQLAQEFALEMA